MKKVQGEPIRVLVVDDYEPFRNLVSSIIRKHPLFTVAGEARDGVEAIQLAEQLRPALIVLDIGLPKINGIEAARKIHARLPDAKIVYLTQESSPDVASAAFAIGASAYVIKTHAETEFLPALVAVSMGGHFISAALPEGVLGETRATPSVSRSTPQHRPTPLLTLEDLGIPAAELAPDCSLRQCNHHLSSLLGYAPGQMPNGAFDEVFPPETSDTQQPACETLISGETSSCSVERLATRKDGTTFPVSIALSAVRDSAGQPLKSILAVVTDLTPLRTAMDKLMEAETARRELATRLVSGMETERTRIGRELHDDICQSLALLAMQFRRADKAVSGMPGHQHPGVSELCDKLRDVAGRVSRISHQLHSANVEYLGLAAAVQGHCREFSEQHRIKVDFTSADVPRKLDSLLAVSLLRIAQEALHNIAKHSHAKSVRVSMHASDGHLILSIEDDGVGFDVEEARFASGLGLISMRERVHLAGGAFTLTSAPGKGTQIVASVPIPPSKPASQPQQSS